MLKGIFAAIFAMAAVTAVPAEAAFFTVTAGDTFAVPDNNDFQSNLAALGLTNYTTQGATITLSNNSRVRFDYIASESGFTDYFTAGSLASYAEFNKSVFAPLLIGTDLFAAGAFNNVTFTTNGSGLVSNPGSESFGIFIPGLLPSSGTYTSRVLYFGFDDQINNIDDNHDDFIVRVTAVPEPASWAMLVMGFGLVGYGARRRQGRSVTA